MNPSREGHSLYIRFRIFPGIFVDVESAFKITLQEI